MSNLITEVVVYNIESALNAQNGGADRVELCDNPGGGGTTPSSGTIEMLRKKLEIELFVMVRPREGDFCYSELEFEAMKSDIRHAKQLDADGVVLGILRPEGRIDRERNKKLIDLARPLQVTCHRAFDMTRDPVEALEDCVAAGFDRILTSGQQAQAKDGIDLISRLVKAAEDRIKIMAGCGIDEDTVEEIVERTGVHEIHLAAEGSRSSLMQYQNSQIAGMGTTTGREYKVIIADDSRVAETRRRALQSYERP